MRFFLCAACLILGLSGCGGPIERPERTDFSSLVRVNGDEVRTLDPHRVSVTYEVGVVSDLFLGLTDLDPKARPVPGLARNWSVSDDGLTWTFLLRDGLQWSDGAAITAEDFVYSYRRLAAPETASGYSSLLSVITNADAILAGKAPVETLGVAAPNASTLVFTLTAPLPVFPEMTAFAAMVPVPRHVIEKHGEKWSRPENIVSNGAYTIQSWQRQAHMVLKKNPRFIDADTVAIETLTYIPISDNMMAVRRFRAGEVDIIPEFPDPMGPILKEQLGEQVHVYTYQGTYYYVFNNERPPFDNRSIRKALSMAIDRKPIVDSIMRSGYRPAYSMVPPATGFYGEAYKPVWASWPMEKRLAEARTLLANAGITVETPINVEMRINTSDTHQRLGLAIAQMWKPLGVNVTLFNTEAAVHFSDMRKGNYTLARAGWIADYNAADNFLFVFQSKNIGLNYPNYNSPAFDALFGKGQRESDIGTRMGYFRQAEAVLIEDSPILPLYYYVSKNLVADDIEGWENNLPNRHRSRWLRFKRPAS
ncbi:MAG: peptide ABC transporter substrate-binding protein [Pseudomonadota bacterium]